MDLQTFSTAQRKRTSPPVQRALRILKFLGFGVLAAVACLLCLSPIFLAVLCIYQCCLTVGRSGGGGGRGRGGNPTSLVATFLLVIFLGIAWIPTVNLMLNRVIMNQHYDVVTSSINGNVTTETTVTTTATVAPPASPSSGDDNATMLNVCGQLMTTENWSIVKNAINVHSFLPIGSFVFFLIWALSIAFRHGSVDDSYEEEDKRKAVMSLARVELSPPVHACTIVIKSRSPTDGLAGDDAYDRGRTSFGSVSFGSGVQPGAMSQQHAGGGPSSTGAPATEPNNRTYGALHGTTTAYSLANTDGYGSYDAARYQEQLARINGSDDAASADAFLYNAQDLYRCLREQSGSRATDRSVLWMLVVSLIIALVLCLVAMWVQFCPGYNLKGGWLNTDHCPRESLECLIHKYETHKWLTIFAYAYYVGMFTLLGTALLFVRRQYSNQVTLVQKVTQLPKQVVDDATAPNYLRGGGRDGGNRGGPEGLNTSSDDDDGDDDAGGDDGVDDTGKEEEDFDNCDTNHSPGDDVVTAAAATGTAVSVVDGTIAFPSAVRTVSSRRNTSLAGLNHGPVKRRTAPPNTSTMHMTTSSVAANNNSPLPLASPLHSLGATRRLPDRFDPFNASHLKAWNAIRKVCVDEITNDASVLNSMFGPTMLLTVAAFFVCCGYYLYKIYVTRTRTSKATNPFRDFTSPDFILGPVGVTVASVLLFCLCYDVAVIYSSARKCRAAFKQQLVTVTKLEFVVTKVLYSFVFDLSQGVQTRAQRLNGRAVRPQQLEELYAMVTSLQLFLEAEQARPRLLAVDSHLIKYAFVYFFLLTAIILSVALVLPRHSDDHA